MMAIYKHIQQVNLLPIPAVIPDFVEREHFDKLSVKDFMSFYQLETTDIFSF